MTSYIFSRWEIHSTLCCLYGCPPPKSLQIWTSGLIRYLTSLALILDSSGKLSYFACGLQKVRSVNLLIWLELSMPSSWYCWRILLLQLSQGLPPFSSRSVVVVWAITFVGSTTPAAVSMGTARQPEFILEEFTISTDCKHHATQTIAAQEAPSFLLGCQPLAWWSCSGYFP